MSYKKLEDNKSYILNIHKIKEENNLKPKLKLSYSDLVEKLFNCISSDNIKNKSQLNLLLFEECLELIILIISSQQKIFSDLEKTNKSNESLISKISKLIEKEIKSNSIFVVEKLLNSLNYISVQSSESKYIEYLYSIIFSIYSSINDGKLTNEINYIEFYEFFFINFLCFCKYII